MVTGASYAPPMLITDTIRAEVAGRAMAQIGKGYRFGMAGPNLYDCSGSTLDAWKPYRALPHNAGQQLASLEDGSIEGCRLIRPGRNVSGTRSYLLARFLLKPGDLAFFYGDVDEPETVTHVATYVLKEHGYRWLVNATNEDRGVEQIHLFQYAKPIAYGFMGH